MTGAGGDTIRSWRLRERLMAKAKFTPEDVLDIHHDAVNPARRDVVRLALHLRDAQKAELSPQALRALKILEPWHKAGASTDLARAGAAVAGELNMFFRMMATPLAQIYGGGNSGVSYWLRTATAKIAADPKAALGKLEIEYVDRCLSGALRSAGSKYGRDPSAWDERARAAVKRRRLGYYVSLDGFGSIDRTKDLTCPALSVVDGNTLKSQGGQCYTQYVPLHEPDAARTVLPIGNSERLDSPHRTDTMELWSTGKLHPAPLSRKAVERIATSRLTLTR
jgi:acyl-homoserine lactone acylase PvdQ